MKSHGDLEALLMIEEMVEVVGVLAHIDLHPVHFTIMGMERGSALGTRHQR